MRCRSQRPRRNPPAFAVIAMTAPQPCHPAENSGLLGKEGRNAFPDCFVFAFHKAKFVDRNPAFASPYSDPSRCVPGLQTVYNIEHVNPRDFLIHFPVQTVGHVTNHIFDESGFDAGYSLQASA